MHDQGTTVSAMTFGRPGMVTEGGSTIVVMPADHFQATVILHYPDRPAIGTQGVTYDPASEDYGQTIAPARTFGFLSEIEALRARGLGLGASYENAVVLNESGMCLNGLRFPNELARHKLLDLIGDLALIGQPLQAHIIAIKPSHALNVRLARLLS
jgi:UDP-3-O-[3-hydroxymyristoyl] N-acetylglucosamine deacetylase